MLNYALVAATMVGLTALPLIAQTEDHSGQAMTGEETPATMAFMEADAKMHADMTVEYTGDADVDFVKSMIPHHQGAVNMARIVLEHGTDPEVRTLAEGVIKAQEAEIQWMTDWLEKYGQ